MIVNWKKPEYEEVWFNASDMPIRDALWLVNYMNADRKWDAELVSDSRQKLYFVRAVRPKP